MQNDNTLEQLRERIVQNGAVLVVVADGQPPAVLTVPQEGGAIWTVILTNPGALPKPTDSQTMTDALIATIAHAQAHSEGKRAAEGEPITRTREEEVMARV